MSNEIRRQVLNCFKSIHRTRCSVFAGDKKALEAARIKINQEFAKNKHVENTSAISALLQLSKEVELELRTQVIQAKEVKPGVYEAKITEQTLKLDNVPFNDCETSKANTRKGKNKTIPCSQNK